MKSKSFRGIAAVLALALAGLLAWPAVMSAQMRSSGNPGYYRFFQVQNEYGEPYTRDGFVACDVFSTDENGNNPTFVTHAAATMVNADARSGPLYSNTNGIIHWYSRHTEPADVVCYTRSGDSGRRAQMNIREHKLQIGTSGAMKVIRLPVSTNTSPVSTGYYIPEGALVKGVAVRVDTPGATVAHIDVGFGGNHAYAFRNALANRLQMGPSSTAGSRGFNTYLNPTGVAGATWPDSGIQSIPTNHLGVLLSHNAVSAGQTNRVYNGGVLVHTTGGIEVTYTTSNTASVGGHLYVFFEMLHTGRIPQGQGF